MYMYILNDKNEDGQPPSIILILIYIVIILNDLEEILIIGLFVKNLLMKTVLKNIYYLYS